MNIDSIEKENFINKSFVSSQEEKIIKQVYIVEQFLRIDPNDDEPDIIKESWHLLN